MRECPACHQCFSDQVERCPDDNQPTRQTFSIENYLARRYLLQNRIGQGSVSVVYSAHDQQDNNTVAIKIILPDLMGNDSIIRESFLSEARAAAALHHPNIVTITECGVANEVIPFIVMEFVSGSSLQDILAGQRALPAREAGEYVSAIAAGLGFAHEAGIVHGDLKPRNILVKADQPIVAGVKILDFGMSGLKAGRLRGARVAKRGGMLRSANYLAPEEWSDDEEPQSTSDIYSLGVILYQMLAGELPFKGSNSAIMKQHLMNTPPPLGGRAGPISGELEAVVQRALSKEPEQRPATMAQFVAELQAAIDATPTVASKRRKTSTRPKTREATTTTRATRARKQEATAHDQDLQSPTPDDSAPFEGFATLVHPRFAKQAPPAEANTNLDQTIVLTAERPSSDLDQTIVLTAKRPTSDLDQTIVLKKKPVDLNLPETPQPAQAADPHFEAASPTAIEPAVEEPMPEPVDDFENAEFEDDSYVGDAAPVPRAIPPWLLAIGVLVFVILIAVGIYYSRQPE